MAQQTLGNPAHRPKKHGGAITKPVADKSKKSKSLFTKTQAGGDGPTRRAAATPAAGANARPPHAAATPKPSQQEAAPSSTTEQPRNNSGLGATEASLEEDLPSSRLCVKNLPKYMTDAALKKLFSAKGEVTDIKIMRTRDGVSRQLAFVGFKSEQEAAAARKYFDATYVDAMRITVEFARSYKDPTLARPWSKHSVGSSAHARLAGPTDVDGSQAEALALSTRLKARAGKKGPLDELTAQDPKLAEFLALMAPRSRAKLWANDELAPQQTLKDLMAPGGEGASSDDEEYQDLPKAGLALGGGAFGRLHNGTDRDGEEQEAGERSEDSAAAMEGDDEAAVDGKDQMVVSEVVSDLEYLKSRMRKWSDADDEEEAKVEDGQVTGTVAQAAAGALDALPGVPVAGGADGTLGAGPTELPPAPPLPPGGAAAAVVQAAHDLIVDPEAAVRATSRLFLRNLGYGVTEADLLELAGKHGDVASVHLVMERETKKSKGIAYVQYVMPDDAVKAYQQLDGTIFQGRLLHVLPAKAPSSGVVGVEWEGQGVGGLSGGAGEGERHAAGSSYKATKEEKRKADAGNRAAWNSLFMRADTVQEAVAAHYGVTKSELMDARGSSDLAVRVALGEAAIIQQTKAALLEQGVNVPSLESAAAAGGSAAASRSNVARSPTTLLVKNLPFSTTEDALLELFGRSGPVLRLVLPPSHALALVEYGEPQDARAAFKALAYKQFQHVPLYLEWAPRDIFSHPPPAQPLYAVAAAQAKQPAPGEATAQAKEQQRRKGDKAAAQGAGTDNGDSTQGAEGVMTNKPQDAEDEEGDRTCSIYVKNLAFATTDASMKKHFDKVVSEAGGVLHSARVSRRKHPTTGELLSAGYGFVEVDSPEVAAAVVTKLQNSLLDHHKLSLQLSKRKPEATGAAATAAGKRKTAAVQGADGAAAGAASGAGAGAGNGTGATATKLVVRNVAFEATRKDLVGLFSPFGHLKSCRLPKKFDGSHRGFGFIEFVTKQEARNAVEGVTGTHLYGRRLVVEYAKEEGGLDELRAKTGAKYRGEDEAEVLGTGAGAPAAKRLKRSL